MAIPAENDVIDLTVTAQQGFGGRRPKPKKKYSGKYFVFRLSFVPFVFSCLGTRVLKPKEKYIAVLGKGARPRCETLLNGDSSPM